MSIRSGLAGQAMFAVESTYGTFVAPTRSLEIEKESIKHDRLNIDSNAIRANMRVLRSDRYKRVGKGAAGTITMPAWNKGLGMLMQTAFGVDTITTPSGATNTRDHTSTYTDPFGKMLTVQIGRPDVSGTVQPFSYLGGKILGTTFSNDVDGYLMIDWDFDFQDVTTAQALGTFTPPTALELLSFAGGTISVGGSQKDVVDVKASFPHPQKTDRYFIKNSATKKEPIINALAVPTVEITADFESLTEYGRFTGDSTAAITLLWEGSIIEAGGGATVNPKYGFQITITAARTNEYEAQLDSVDVIPEKVTYQVMDDGTNPPVSVRYRTVDTTV